MTHHKAKSGHLYVIATQSGLVKFGISINPKNRLRQHALTFGAVSPIVDAWVSPAFIGYKEAEQRLISIYKAERVTGVSFLDVVCDAQLAYEDFSGIYESALNQAYSENLGGSDFAQKPSESIARANFLLDNTDQDLTAYFLVPIVCQLMGKAHDGMPLGIRDYIANKITTPDYAKLSLFLSRLAIGGSYADAALESVGLTNKDFDFKESP